MAINWNSSLETGNKTIDEQHKSLIKAIDDLLDACQKREAAEQIGKTADFLLSYTTRHFADEERLSASAGYPDFARHKKLHEDFKIVVKNIVDELKQKGANMGMVGKVNNTITQWLVNHIMVEDKKVAAFIKSKQ